MANNQYKNKVVYNGNTLIDLTGDTVTAADLAQGVTAHDASGAPITGTMTGGAIIISDTTDVHGGTIREITAQEVVNLQSGKSVTPTESAQIVEPDTGYDAFASVNVGAISSTYVGSGITQRSSTDLTASGATVSVPSGYYASNASKAVSSGSATTPATTITANPTISVNSSTGVITASNSKTQSVTPTVSAGYVSSGTSGTITVSGSNTSNLSTQAGTTITPTESQQTAVSAGKYTLGDVKVGAISSTYVGSGITQRSSTDLTASGATVTVPSGYYSSQATKSVTSGTAGTPTATKGAVSNHSISVTPSVANTAGYISGGTVNGTAVSVSASELVSGSQTVTENDTYDVTNLAEVVVDVPSSSCNLTTATVTPNDNTQIVWPDEVLRTANRTNGASSRTTGVYTILSSPLSPATALTDNATYYVWGTITVTDSNGDVVETYNVAKTAFEWKTASTTILENPSTAIISTAQISKNTSTYAEVKVLWQQSGTYGVDSKLNISDTNNYDGFSSVTVNPVPSTYYSSDLIKKFIQRDYTFTSFTFPDGIAKIGDYVFASCNQLVLTSLPSGITEIGSYAFYLCSKIELSSLPSSVTIIGVYAFYSCLKITVSSLPSGLTSISQYAFYGCEKLGISSLPSGITSIGSYAFYNCHLITVSSLPSGLTSIGGYAFQNCNRITAISCDGTITTMSAYSFNGNISYEMQLASARFPNMALTGNIAQVFGSTTAANACHYLEIVDLGKTTGIAASAFANCYALQTLILRKTTVCTLSNVSAFTNTPMNGYNSMTGTVYVPNDLISSYQTATNWSTLYNDGTVTFTKIEGSIYELS